MEESSFPLSKNCPLVIMCQFVSCRICHCCHPIKALMSQKNGGLKRHLVKLHSSGVPSLSSFFYSTPSRNLRYFLLYLLPLTWIHICNTGKEVEHSLLSVEIHGTHILLWVKSPSEVSDLCTCPWLIWLCVCALAATKRGALSVRAHRKTEWGRHRWVNLFRLTGAHTHTSTDAHTPTVRGHTTVAATAMVLSHMSNQGFSSAALTM